MAPKQSKECPVHKAVRDNNFIKLKIFRMSFASLESYNYNQERPIDISIENDNLEMTLYILKNTEYNVFKDIFLAKKCSDFLSEKIVNKKLDFSLMKKYKIVWEAFFSQRREDHLEGMPKNVTELENLMQEWLQDEEN